MNQDIKKKWINAMRTSHSRVAPFRLRSYPYGMVPDDDASNSGWGANGVLCDLYRRESGRGAWVGSGFSLCGEHFDFDSNEEEEIPAEVLKWAGLARNQSMIIMNINDTEAWPEKNFNSVISYLEQL